MPNKVTIVFELSNSAKLYSEGDLKRIVNAKVRQMLGNDPAVALSVEPNFEVMVE